jgi:hypothetical protein
MRWERVRVGEINLKSESEKEQRKKENVTIDAKRIYSG